MGEPDEASLEQAEDRLGQTREALLDFVARFHEADSYMDGVEKDPEATRLWLNELFTLHVAFRGEQLLKRRESHTFRYEATVEVDGAPFTLRVKKG